jgi:hypothetical protein
VHPNRIGIQTSPHPKLPVSDPQMHPSHEMHLALSTHILPEKPEVLSVKNGFSALQHYFSVDVLNS